MGVRYWTGLAILLAVVGVAPMDALKYQHRMVAEYVPPDLVPVPGGWESVRSYFLRREAASAYDALHAAAGRDGIALRIVSAYRSFDRQDALYRLQLRIDGPGQTTVARPGFSEHQLGEALDLCGPEPAAVLHATFAETAAGRWLAARAPDFGFAVSYTEANRAQTGFSPEPWHYRYVGSDARARHEAAMLGSR